MYKTRKGILTNGLEIDRSMFKMSPEFTIGVLVIVSVVAVLYSVLW